MELNNSTIKRFKDMLELNRLDQRGIDDFERYCNGKKITPEDRVIALSLLETAKKAPLPPRAQVAGPGPSPAGPRQGFGGQGGRNPASANAGYSTGGGNGGHQGQGPVSSKNRDAAGPDAIGSPFTNPYTFIPFPTREQQAERKAPTPLTIDEQEVERRSGLIKVEVRTLSPLLSSASKSREEETGDEAACARQQRILGIGDDVIVPASSLRGSLRTLLSIITCGPLSCLDENLWLCQGRDVKVDLSQGGILAKVVTPGSSTRDGVVDIGTGTKLVPTAKLERLMGGARELDQYRLGGRSDRQEFWTDADCTRLESRRTAGCDWQVKLSGRKIGRPGTKRPKKNGTPSEEHDGMLCLTSSYELTLPSELWLDYQSRNRSGAVPELKQGQLVWLVPKSNVSTIESGEDVDSIQWARWGKKGQKYKDLLVRWCPWMMPDSLRADGKVDMVSDLFGMVSLGAGDTFALAARVVPDNLVFTDARSSVQQTYLPALSTPHPGCKAFYFENLDDDYDQLSLQDIPRGYKVYRTSAETGEQAPWNYSAQPIYMNGRPANPSGQNLIRRVELLPAGKSGSFSLAFRALNERELSLLLLALSCDLRLGGGKPLGLGHCLATKITVEDEGGEVLASFSPDGGERGALPESVMAMYPVEKLWQEKARLYCLTQKPVAKLRYPSAGRLNKNGALQRGGHQWFSYFAEPTKGANSEDAVPKGMQVLRTAGELRFKAGGRDIRAQILPKFQEGKPADGDLLFGLNLCGEGPHQGNINNFERFVPAGTVNDAAPRHEENRGPNRQRRQDDRRQR